MTDAGLLDQLADGARQAARVISRENKCEIGHRNTNGRGNLGGHGPGNGAPDNTNASTPAPIDPEVNKVRAAHCGGLLLLMAYYQYYDVEMQLVL